MNKKIKIGMIGFGGRGISLLRSSVLPSCGDEYEVTAVCDVYPDRLEEAANEVEKILGKRPLSTSNSDELLSSGIDAVIITAGWEAHIDLAVAAMKKGVRPGVEVAGAYSLDDCWRLVRTYEETGIHCMMLENCCYGQRELMITNMVRQGVFGTIVHCAGGYHHDLRELVSTGKECRSYRLNNYIYRNCENYPTHEAGPIAKLLHINNGNRMLTLNSVSSAAVGLHEYCLAHREPGDPLRDTHVLQGDIVTTVIKCSGGQTITITLDTTLPRLYSRAFTVRGTKGMYFEDNDSIYIDGVHQEFEWEPRKIWGNAGEYAERYQHPLWQDFKKTDDHGGMDTLVINAFLDSVKRGKRPPIDTYDTAVLMAITPLSEESILKGGAPVVFPDFTGGRWYRRNDIDTESEFCID